VLLTAFSVHEFAHAWTANAFGDDTPRLYGRLTLNPAAHLDVIGSLMLIVAGFGWAKPVPVNPYLLRRRSPSALMWVALAGPLSNLLMAVIAAVPFKLGLLSLSYQIGSFLPNLPQLLLAFVSINLVLMLFNLIPLAPLDGEKVVDYFFPPTWGRVWEQIRPYGPMILMALMFIAPMIGLDIIGWIIYPPLQALLNLLVG
jgi:Zn-dependent protease